MRAIRFDTFGPFDFQTKNGGVDPSALRTFWRSVAERDALLPGAVGCYIFAMKAGHKLTPWYVGKTEKGSFKGETCQPHKLLYYGNVIRKHKRAKPVLFLLAKRTATGKYVKPTTRHKYLGSIAALEEMLIGTCLQRNDALLNKSKTKYLKRICVPGYVNDSPTTRTKGERDLARLLKTQR